jgi:hypothetical protein
MFTEFIKLFSVCRMKTNVYFCTNLLNCNFILGKYSSESDHKRNIKYSLSFCITCLSVNSIRKCRIRIWYISHLHLKQKCTWTSLTTHGFERNVEECYSIPSPILALRAGCVCRRVHYLTKSLQLHRYILNYMYINVKV